MMGNPDSALTSVHSVASSLSSINDSPGLHCCPIEMCGKAFSKKYNLKAHLRLHTGEQPFCCTRPNCGKKFKWRSSLSSHSVWHTRQAASTGDVSDSSPSPSSIVPEKTKPGGSQTPSFHELKHCQIADGQSKRTTSSSRSESKEPATMFIQTALEDFTSPTRKSTSSPSRKHQRSDATSAVAPKMRSNSAPGRQKESHKGTKRTIARAIGEGAHPVLVKPVSIITKSDVRKRRLRSSNSSGPSLSHIPKLETVDIMSESLFLPGDLDTSSVLGDTPILSPTPLIDEDPGSPLSSAEDAAVFELDAIFSQDDSSPLSFSSSPILAELDSDVVRFGAFDLENFHNFDTRLEFSF